MRRYVVACSLAGIAALGVSLAAQNPPTPAQTPPPSQTATSPSAVTVEGCLMTKSSAAGAMEDYVLTNAKVIKGTAPAGAAPPARAGEPTGTSGTTSGPTYDVKGIDEARLKQFAGKRVQIDGSFDAAKSPTASASAEAPGVKGTAIRQVTGDCPAK